MNHAHDSDSEQMLALLKWQSRMGVNIAICDSPVDRFLQKDIAAPAPGELSNSLADIDRKKPKSAQIPIEANNGDPEKAKKAAQRANSVEELSVALGELEGCSLRLRATNTVFYGGNPKADLMMIGKAPSKQDDLQGEMFVGRAGQLLDKMLSAIGLDRNGVYLANVVAWRPPGNRDPAPHEINMCLPFLMRQIELCRPRFIICLGEMATISVLGAGARANKLRGKWQPANIGGHETKVLTSLHPEFLLKQPAQKRNAWHDLQMLKKAMAD